MHPPDLALPFPILPLPLSHTLFWPSGFLADSPSCLAHSFPRSPKLSVHAWLTKIFHIECSPQRGLLRHCISNRPPHRPPCSLLTLLHFLHGSCLCRRDLVLDHFLSPYYSIWGQDSVFPYNCCGRRPSPIIGSLSNKLLGIK